MEGKKTITISTHNICGFNNSKSYLYSMCDKNPDTIRGVQEHWLGPPYKKQSGVNRLRVLHPDFDGFGNSAMQQDVEKEVRIGRGYGGTGFLYNKKFASTVKPQVQYKHGRVSVMKIFDAEREILVINGYMPYYKVKDLRNQIALYQETLAYIENVIIENRNCSVILLLDMNCNIYNRGHHFSKLIIDLMNKYSLLSAFDFIPNFDHDSNYTRCNEKMNSYTLIDGILISESLSDIVSNARIVHDGDNLSDHSPVEIDLRLKLSEVEIPKKVIKPCIMWNKLSQDSIALYRQKMAEGLNEIDVPSSFILHGQSCCSSSFHNECIESYYKDTAEPAYSYIVCNRFSAIVE